MGRTKRFLLATIATISVAGADLFAETINDAFRAAYTNNPEIIATRANVRAASEGIAQARAGLLPQVNLNAQYGRAGQRVFGEWITNDSASATLSASLLVFDGFSTPNSIRAAESDANAALLRLQSSEQQLLLATAQAYIEVLRTGELVSLAQSALAQSEVENRSAQIAFEEGATDAGQRAQAEAALAGARADLVAAQADLEVAKLNYQKQTGLALQSPSPIGNLPSVPASLDVALATARANNPLIRAAVETERSAQYRLAQAKGARLPNITLDGGVSVSDSLDGSDPVRSGSVGLNLNLPIYSGGRISSLARQAEALLVARSAETNNTRQLIDQSAAQAWSALLNTRAALDALNAASDAQDTAARATQVQYEEGLVDLTTKLQRDQAARSARANAASMRYQQQIAIYNLHFMMGTLGVDELNLQIAPIDPLTIPPSQSQPSATQQKIDAIADRWRR